MSHDCLLMTSNNQIASLIRRPTCAALIAPNCLPHGLLHCLPNCLPNQAPNVRCAAIGARTIEIFASHAQVIGAPLSGLHKDKMGEFRMISATEVNGKPVYEKEPSISHMVWASNGYWYVGKRDELGKQAGWMQVLTTARPSPTSRPSACMCSPRRPVVLPSPQVRDSAPLPEEITGVWQIWNQVDKRWIPSLPCMQVLTTAPRCAPFPTGGQALDPLREHPRHRRGQRARRHQRPDPTRMLRVRR